MDLKQIFQKGALRSLLRTAFSNGMVRRAFWFILMAR